MLDFAGYLRTARAVHADMSYEWATPVKRDDVPLNVYLNLDIALSELMQVAHVTQPTVPMEMHEEQDEAAVLAAYAHAFVLFLQASNLMQWTHLMVMEDEDLAKFSRFPQRQLAHQFMGIKTMLLNSYHQKRQSDFSHAWRSFLKLGLVELQLSPEALDEQVQKTLQMAND
ncbi:dUTPase [Weissella ceti]|uniref:dUTPase n=1 Tax=Weissella ceti TaxID=759620 RepID=A0ABT3E255_9LACO|nr:dUTPase [Weissella ceti]MCW0952506.1 dUTPase [Weissella ceti]QVK11825.1 dUTPase [Weissella ceti]